MTYRPRAAFKSFHARHQRFALMVCHRRAGKTVGSINEAVGRAIYNKRKRPRYAYIAPLRSQAKKVAWEYVKEYTEGLEGKKPSESELTVKMAHNDATVELYGADGPNAEAIRGNYFDGAIIDEYGDMNPSVWPKIILPTLSDRGGWAVFIGTFKGKNHFYKMSENYQGRGLPLGVDPVKFVSDRFHMILRADQSGIISPEELALLRSEMDDDEYRQEYLCDPSAAVKGTYYASKLSELEVAGQIYSLEGGYDPEQEVECAFDIGRTDGTACWFWQKRPGGVAIIDFFEIPTGGSPEKCFAELRGRAEGAEHRQKYTYRKIWLPHDAKAKTFSTRRSTIEQFLDEFGPSTCAIVPKLDFTDGISAVRKVLPTCYFSQRTEDGVEGLRAYRREWDEEKKVFSQNPVHDWSSHPSDAFRYLSIVAQPLVLEDAPKVQVVRAMPSAGTLDELFQQYEQRMKMLRRRG